MPTKKKAVLVTDSHRGIYFGFVISRTNAGKTLTLNYRIIVMESRMPARQALESLYRAYIKGMKVK